jgi:hypothetical protein
MNVELHFITHFLWLRGTDNDEILSQIQQAYVTDAISPSSIQRWIHDFADRKTELTSASRPDRATNPENMIRARELMQSEQ